MLCSNRCCVYPLYFEFRLDGSTTTSYIFPTKTFSDKLIVELGNILF